MNEDKEEIQDVTAHHILERLIALSITNQSFVISQKEHSPTDLQRQLINNESQCILTVFSLN
jgi:hypothetical protein